MYTNLPSRQLRELFTSKEVRQAQGNLKQTVIKGADLREFEVSYWERVEIQETFFLGCIFHTTKSETLLQNRGAVLFPLLQRLPYNPYRSKLYSPEELHESTAGVSLDQSIYCDYVEKGRFYPDVVEALYRRIHDDSIDDALARLIQDIGALRMVGVMGGSSVDRTDLWYRKTAQVTRFLTMDNKFVVSGGGPGMMEAANLGAYFSRFSEHDLEDGLKLLSVAPKYTDPKWMAQALEVKRQFPNGGESLGIPTWFYGFEPTNSFATSVAKYFDNSIRETGLLQVAKAGIVFAPGSAGTRQEIFMDAAQNHYGTTGFYSPMVFLGKSQYIEDVPIYPLLQKVATQDYRDFLFITDTPSEIREFIEAHPPKIKPAVPDPICHSKNNQPSG
jgi:predicted Rossmann-fold nucleotide-binding protein